jgi:hypothetical protein
LGPTGEQGPRGPTGSVGTGATGPTGPGGIGNLTAGTGVTITGPTGSPVISIGQAVGKQDNVTFKNITLTENGKPESDTKELLRYNRTFIQTEISYYITDTYPNLIYDAAKYNTHIYNVIEAVIFDSIYGGNSKSIAAGLIYYDPTFYPLDLGIATVEAVDIMNYFKLLVSSVLDNTAPSTVYQQDYPQVIDITKTPSIDDKAKISNLIDIIIVIINTAAAPTLVEPSQGVMTFADGTVQRSHAPKLFTADDFIFNGITVDDIQPGDFLYDYTSSSIFLMIDSGFGYNQLLDLTVRG